jgi:hypothetical protein
MPSWKQAQQGQFYFWPNPQPGEIGDTAYDFLKLLPGPVHIFLQGQASSRSRVVTTLLHGNEPSGIHGVFSLLKNGVRPRTDIHILIPSVDAAKQAPGFIYRMLPHHKDLNRCFREPFGESEQDRLAREMVDIIDAANPECVIDVHNTSGSSPSFGVTTYMDQRHDALVSLFTHRMIVTDIKLGALMERSTNDRPIVTIECGGAQDEESHLLAAEGLKRFMELESVLSLKHTDMSLEFFHNPMRLELKEGSDIAYGDHCLLQDGVTLLPDIENHNFGYVEADVRLGFVSGELASNLKINNPLGDENISDYFRLQDGVLYPSRRLKLFMVTGNPEIARKDCLLYLVTAE